MDAPTRHRIFAELDAWASTANNGLPHDLFVFVSRLTPLVNVDLLIQDPHHGTLLTWRHDETYGPGWHVPGGRSFAMRGGLRYGSRNPVGEPGADIQRNT